MSAVVKLPFLGRYNGVKSIKVLGKQMLVWCIFVCLLSACQGKLETVRVAVSIPTGLQVGVDMLNAAKLALDEADGKAGQVPVQLLVFSTSDPEGSPVSPDLEKEAATKAAGEWRGRPTGRRWRCRTSWRGRTRISSRMWT